MGGHSENNGVFPVGSAIAKCPQARQHRVLWKKGGEGSRGERQKLSKRLAGQARPAHQDNPPL